MSQSGKPTFGSSRGAGGPPCTAQIDGWTPGTYTGVITATVAVL